MKKLVQLCACVSILGSFGCDSGFGSDVSEPGFAPSPIDRPTTSFPMQPPPAGSGAPALPSDNRTPVTLETPPPPISGGTLLVASDGTTAVAADPDRDRVTFVDLLKGTVLAELKLGDGAEPGRVAEDANGRVHVVLRGAGELATIDLSSYELISRRPVCNAPRGVAYDEAGDVLHVACLGGELKSLPAAGGDAVRDVSLGTDIRDVVVTNHGLRVTRFRSAQVLELDDAGSAVAERSMHTINKVQFDNFKGTAAMRTFAPALARRAVPMAGGESTLVLHERELDDTIEISDPHDPNSVNSAVGPGGGNAYGGSSECSSIVQAALSEVDANGKVTHSMSISGVVLPVDVALSPDGRTIAIADAGGLDFNAPQLFPTMSGLPQGGVALIRVASSPMVESQDIGQGCMFPDPIQVDGQATAVAFTPDGALVAQSRQPARLQLIGPEGTRTIDLGGGDRLDTGHELFHRNAGAGISCASCHGEGGDDGHVWNFSSLGPRRTQSVNVGLEGTEPFHWSGDMANLETLVREVFVARMGGAPQAASRVEALGEWLYRLQAPIAPRAQNDEAALRGHELFASEEVGCTGCHSGAKLTNNKTVDVGTGEPMQVPTLVGIAYRAPFIHTGCASTLHDRFDPSCGGGDKHGRTSQLSPEQIDDLVAYLETL